MDMVSVLAEPVAVAQAFSPGHITGFFIKPQIRKDYLHTGSTGAGFSISKGISTLVKVYESSQSAYSIFINGIPADNAVVSKRVTEHYLALSDKPYSLKIEHNVEIPIGYGLGSSGAAALSLSYSLNSALNTGLGKNQAAQIAHRAELECKTGLGTVIAEYGGGFEIRTKAGAPGIGDIQNIPLPGYKAIILCLAPISTKSILSKSDMSNFQAENMLKEIQRTKSIDDFMRMSFTFSKKMGLTDGMCKSVVEELRANAIQCGIALFGHTVFSVLREEKIPLVRNILSRHKGHLIECDIDTDGARLT